MAPPNPPSSSATSNDEPESYSAMSVGDVEAIGAHCQMAFCHQLDFLPFRCDSCRGTYCLDHRSETAHSCPKAGEWARRRAGLSPSPTPGTTTTTGASHKPNILTHEAQCASPSCKTLIDTSTAPGVHCTRCNRRYCLKHRMQEDHECATLQPLGARPAPDARDKGLAALAKLRAWGASKKAAAAAGTASSSSSGGGGTASGKSSGGGPFASLKKIASGGSSSNNSNSNSGSSVAAMQALKRTAKGDAKLAADKRVYLYVEASADTTTAKYPTGKFFYSKEWNVGRMLDAAAKALQVANSNNRSEGEADKLRVFHVEAGRLLEFKEKLGDACRDGNTLVLLRGVGPGVPDLIVP